MWPLINISCFMNTDATYYYCSQLITEEKIIAGVRMKALLIFLSLLVCLDCRSCHGRDTISADHPLKDNGETVISAGKKFELGFFSPEGNSSIYVGIWYYQMEPRTIVWTANRDNPLPDSTGVVEIANNGQLKVFDAKRTTYFYTEHDRKANIAKLLDSGNLVLFDRLSGELWKSFEHPTDTFLPGMLMNYKLRLTSWLSHTNPGKGNFTFQQDQDSDKLYITMKRIIVYWRSGEPGEFFSNEKMPFQVAALLKNFSKNPEDYKNPPESLKSLIQGLVENNNTRLLLDSSGQIQFFGWDKQFGWSQKWSEPRDPCSVYNYCGDFGSCSSGHRPLCKCFPGFEPTNPEKWNAEDFNNGCKTKFAACANTQEQDTFLNLKLMKVGKPDSQVPEAGTEDKCRAECLGDCKCQAYSFVQNSDAMGTRESSGCWIWTSNLKNLRERYTDEGRNLSVRVAVSYTESTKSDCKPCGETLIPFPLSDGPACGDPKYSKFSCNDLTGQVEFKIANDSYQIVNIDKEKRSFVVEVKDEIGRSCEAKAKEIMLLNQSTPFVVNKACFTDALAGNSINLTQGQQKIEIIWNPPSEPTCKSSSDCQDWPSSDCNMQLGQGRCLCRPNYKWDGLILNCTAVVHPPKSSTSNIRIVIIVAVVIAAVLVICSLGYCFYKRTVLAERTARTESTDRNPLPYVHNSSVRTMDLIGEDDSKGTGVSWFKLESIVAATDNFSDANQLGKGGFGPVYKGRFPGGQYIAVKRLSSHSGQGMEEFKNEVALIAKLQHRNLVRIMGYCVERNEKILLYEYMPNKSLDTFIFDEKLSILLDWKKRFDIILGISRGLLYLHQDSRLRIIHRDLKTSNILLDEEMNPKISDFGLARIIEGTQTQANTSRVVGTHGYISPEYALEGQFSVKSDAFSFGVIVLEIVCGKRNTGFYQSQEALNLLGYAWRLWKEEKALDLLDNTLIESCNKSEVLKSINIGLLCVQEDPTDRPTMENVIAMLVSESATIQSPKQPPYIERKRLPSTSSSSSHKTTEALSHNELTITMQEGR